VELVVLSGMEVQVEKVLQMLQFLVILVLEVDQSVEVVPQVACYYYLTLVVA
jgi:hypothetical protein